MPSLTTWNQTNTHTIKTVVAAIEQRLDAYIAREANPTPESLPDIDSILNSAAASASPPLALTHLCTTFNLSPFERNVLLLCAASALIPYFPQLCVEAHSCPQSAYPTFNLAMQLFGDAGAWQALSPMSPLHYWQLVKTDPSVELPQSRLQLDNGILLYLLGQPYEDAQLMHLIQPIEAGIETILQPSHQQIGDRITQLWQTNPNSQDSLAEPLVGAGLVTYGNNGNDNGKTRPYTLDTQQSNLPIIQLCNTTPSAAQDIATTVSTRLNRPLKHLPAHRLPTHLNEISLLIRRWHRDAILSQSILLLDCQELNTSDTPLMEALCYFLQALHTPLIISTPERLPSAQRPFISFDIPSLTHLEQLHLWQTHLGETANQLNGEVESLVAQFNLTHTDIQAACISFHSDIAQLQTQPKPKGRKKTTTDNQSSPLTTHLWDICRIQSRPRLEDLAQRLEPTATWDDFVLPEPELKLLKDMVNQVRQRVKVYTEWGFGHKSNRGLGISALFAGQSGTGKTMAAEVLANALRLDLYRIDLSAVISKYIGETEKNLRRIFDAAETGGAILLFDEADAIFGKRTQVKDSHDRHANVEVSYLLQRMEAYQGLAILTTNLKESLDQAFLRRIRFIVKFPYPDAASRAKIWEKIFPKETPTRKLDYARLGKLQATGGNIRSIAMNAAFFAAEEGKPVTMQHLLDATKQECAKLERGITSVEIQGWVK
ncbi:MAG: ATP-binding protein [Coleofasciculus sp.]